MKTVCWKLLKLFCQPQSIDKIPLWSSPLDTKTYKYHLPLTILHLCMKYESYTLKTTQVIIDLWPFDPKMYRYLPLATLHLCMKYESFTLKSTLESYRVRAKALAKVRFDLGLWTPKCIGIFLSPSCIYVWNMKAVRWKKTQAIVSEPKCWQKSIVTLTFRPQKCIGIFHSPSCIYVWNIKICTLKITEVTEPKCWQSSVVTLTFDLLTPKCIGIFLSPSCIYVSNIIAVHWKLLNFSCQNLSVDKSQSCGLDLLIPKCIYIGIFLSTSCIYVWNMKVVR